MFNKHFICYLKNVDFHVQQHLQQKKIKTIVIQKVYIYCLMSESYFFILIFLFLSFTLWFFALLHQSITK